MTAADRATATFTACKRARIARDRVPYGNPERFQKACRAYDRAYSAFVDACREAGLDPRKVASA